jgi:hypothetical protein
VAKNPYEWLYEREKQPLKEYVLDEVAKHLAKAVESFPPQIEEWESEELRLRFAPLLSTMADRPRLGVVRIALKLYRWELERDVEAIDHFVRNHQWSEEEATPAEIELATFLWQYWLEQTLAFKEYAQEKFRWRELIGLAERMQVQLVEGHSPLRTTLQ